MTGFVISKTTVPVIDITSYTIHPLYALIGLWMLTTAQWLHHIWWANRIILAWLFLTCQALTITSFWICTPGSGDHSPQRRIRDQTVVGSTESRQGFSFSESNISLCWPLFRYPFHPRVTAAARKRSRSFCQKCWWQVTAKYACTVPMWLCMKWHGVHRTRRHGGSFMWHQPCQRFKHTTSVDIQKRGIKSYSLM